MKPSPSCQDQVLYEGETGIMSAGSRASFGGCVSVLVVDKHETVAVLADMPNRVPGGTVPFYGGGFRLFPFAGMRPLTACLRKFASVIVPQAFDQKGKPKTCGNSDLLNF